MGPRCEAEDCTKPVDRDGVCFRHRLLSVGTTGLTLFKHDREHGLTQAHKLREQVEGAKNGGPDIMQVRGKKGAHQKWGAEGWVKV